MSAKKRKNFSYPRVLMLGFGIIIVIGTLLLCLPISSRAGQWGNPVDCLLTATSATCVTGLIAYDTFTHWTLFGQIVIISLIQIGGLGFMTLISMFALFLKKKISLRDRLLLMQSSGSMQLVGVGALLRRILKGTLLFEGIGAAILSTRFIPQFGLWEGLYNAVFHSISAFCNAGFDLMGKHAPFSSFTFYQSDPLVLITIMALVVIGGLGFIVWSDIKHHHIHFSRYSLHSKIVLISTLALLLFGTVFFFLSEGEALGQMNFGERLLGAAFQSVTLRTAGFNSFDQTALSSGGSILSMILMLIGGSPASTAGGVKTVTVAVVFITALAVIRNRREVEVGKRQLSALNIRQAFSVLIIYISVTLLAATLLSFTETAALRPIFYEVCSAIGTVGLTMGLTTSLSVAGRIIITLLMFFGRIGGLSLAMAFAETRAEPPLQRPEENILIG